MVDGKKYLCLIVCVLVSFLSACTPRKEAIAPASTNATVIDSGEYYRIYKENSTCVRYDIYDANGEIVLSEETDRPLKVTMLSENIVDIAVDMGTGIAAHKYYSVSKSAFSPEFSYVLSHSDNRITYLDVPKESPFDNRKVIVQDLFDKDSFRMEFSLDFAPIDTPVLDAAFSNDGTALQLSYLSKDEQQPISTVLQL